MLAGSAVLAASPVPYPRAPAQYPHASTICPGPSSLVDGVPAIRPHNDCTPSFTEQDVRSYLAATRQLALATAPNDIAFVGTPQIVSIQFLSLPALNLNPYAPAWQLSDRVVCYVSLPGTFFQFIALLHFHIIPCGTCLAPPPSSSTLTRATYLAVDSTIC